MTTKRRPALRSFSCPKCGQKGNLQRIIYGMPDPETFDFEKYAVGGCCLSGDAKDPDVQCRECEWEGFRDNLPIHKQPPSL